MFWVTLFHWLPITDITGMSCYNMACSLCAGMISHFSYI